METGALNATEAPDARMQKPFATLARPERRPLRCATDRRFQRSQASSEEKSSGNGYCSTSGEIIC
jgi:hypothetical protein